MSSMTVGWFHLREDYHWLFQSLFIVKIFLLSFEYPYEAYKWYIPCLPTKACLLAPVDDGVYI